MPKAKGADDQDLEQRDVLQAVVLADSFAKNFRPVTWTMPKVLMPLANVPMLEYTMEFLAAGGVQEIFIFCNAHADEVEVGVSANGVQEPLQVAVPDPKLAVGVPRRHIGVHLGVDVRVDADEDTRGLPGLCGGPGDLLQVELAVDIDEHALGARQHELGVQLPVAVEDRARGVEARERGAGLAAHITFGRQVVRPSHHIFLVLFGSLGHELGAALLRVFIPSFRVGERPLAPVALHQAQLLVERECYLLVLLSPHDIILGRGPQITWRELQNSLSFHGQFFVALRPPRGAGPRVPAQASTPKTLAADET